MRKLKEQINVIGAKSLIFALIILILTVSIASYAGNQIHQLENELLVQKGKLITSETAREYDNYLIMREDLINRTAYSVNLLIQSDAPTEEVIRYLEHETDYISSILGNETTGLYGYINNEYVDGAGWVPDEDYVPTERPWYVKTMESDNSIVFIEPYLDANTKTVMMTVTKRIKDNNIIALDIGLDNIQGIVEKLSEATMGSQAFILNSEGIVVVHSDENELGKNYLTGELPTA